MRIRVLDVRSLFAFVMVISYGKGVATVRVEPINHKTWIPTVFLAL